MTDDDRPDPGRTGQPAVRARRSVADRWFAFRNRLLARPAFQAWASRTFLVSGHARREARQLFDLTAGFAYSQVLSACLKTGCLTSLAEGPATPETLAPRLGLDLIATRRLLKAASALRLAERRSGDRYGLGMLGAALLGQPGVQAMITHHEALYEDLVDPVALIASGGPGQRLGETWAYATTENPDEIAPEAAGAYTGIMAASQAFIAGEILSAVSFAPFQRHLDVGGGNGSFLAAVARHHPNLSLHLFDLPAVVHHARARLEGEGLSDRLATTAGSFRTDPLPEGADVITLVRILHDHDDATVTALLAKVHAALPPGGTLIVAEPMAETAGGERVEAYFVMFLLAMGSGELRTRARLTQLLSEAGFEAVREHRTRNPLLVRVLSARRPQ